MSKRKDDEALRLEKKIRDLKSENRHLKQEMKKEKKAYKPEFDKEELMEESSESKQLKCPDCGKGDIKKTNLGKKDLLICGLCGKRKVIDFK